MGGPSTVDKRMLTTFAETSNVWAEYTDQSNSQDGRHDGKQ